MITHFINQSNEFVFQFFRKTFFNDTIVFQYNLKSVGFKIEGIHDNEIHTENKHRKNTQF